MADCLVIRFELYGAKVMIEFMDWGKLEFINRSGFALASHVVVVASHLRILYKLQDNKTMAWRI